MTKMSRVPVHGANVKAHFFLYLCRAESRLGRGSITLPLILSLSFLVYKIGEMIVSGQSAADTMTEMNTHKADFVPTGSTQWVATAPLVFQLPKPNAFPPEPPAAFLRCRRITTLTARLPPSDFP